MESKVPNTVKVNLAGEKKKRVDLVLNRGNMRYGISTVEKYKERILTIWIKSFPLCVCVCVGNLWKIFNLTLKIHYNSNMLR